jgi:hypothetical protein
MEKGTTEEANQLIKVEIDRTETTIGEEEARMRQEEGEGDVDREIEPNMEGDQDEIDELLAPEAK